MTGDGFTSHADGPAVPAAGRFAWLGDKHGRRSGLAEVEFAVAHGWDLDAAGRAELARGLGALLGGGDLSERERGRVTRTLRAMDAATGRPPERTRLSASRNRPSRGHR